MATGAAFVAATVQSVVAREEFDVGELFFLFEEELAHIFGGMDVSALLVVDFAAVLTSLKVIIELVGLFAIGTYFRVELFAGTPQTETEVFSDLSSVVVLFLN